MSAPGKPTLRPDNHELWRLVQNRLNQRPPIPMEQIATEIGVDAKAMVDWFLAYRKPKLDVRVRMATPAVTEFEEQPPAKPKPRPRALQRMPAPEMISVENRWGRSADRQRYANWRKAQAGAAAALGKRE